MIRWNNKIIIGVDPGNYNTKTSTTHFTSGIKRLGGKELVRKDILAINKSLFALTNKRIAKRDNKTLNPDFYYLTMFAIAKELVENGINGGAHEIILSTGLPPGHMTRDLVSALVNYYKGPAGFAFEGRSYNLNISRVIVAPQGYAPVLAPVLTYEMLKMKARNELGGKTRPIDILIDEPQAAFIDIGGGSTDVIPFEYGKAQFQHIVSLPMGTVDIYNEIIPMVKAKTGVTLHENTLDLIAQKNKNVRISEDVMSIVNSQLNASAEQALMKVLELDYPFNSAYTVLLGGGSLIMHDCWSSAQGQFGMLDYIAEIGANAIGFEHYAKAVLDEEQKR